MNEKYTVRGWYEGDRENAVEFRTNSEVRRNNRLRDFKIKYDHAEVETREAK